MSADTQKILTCIAGWTHDGVTDDAARAELAALVERAEKAEARLAQTEIGSRQRAMERERAIEERDALAARLKEVEGQQPACWTLKETLAARSTTATGHLWFSDPKNSGWAPLYAGPVAQPNPWREAVLADKSEATDVRCQCGVRPASDCAGAWEPGCDLGHGDEHVADGSINERKDG